mgnify:CR=1 FL=1
MHDIDADETTTQHRMVVPASIPMVSVLGSADSLLRVVGLQPMAVTADLNITFLRPAVGGDLVARAELIRAGRARIFGQVRVWVDGSEDRPVAHATGNYALLESR